MGKDEHIRQKYTNEHLLWINTGYADKSQIVHVLKKAIYDINEKLELDMETQFKVNVVKKLNGKPLGHAYLWVTNPSIYHCLLGLDPEGNKLVEYIEDKNWKPGTQAEKDTLLKKIEETYNWADKEDLHEEYMKLEEPTLIEQEIAPIFKLERIHYTEQQKKMGLQDEPDNPPLYYEPTIEKGYVNEAKPEYQTDVLMCKNVPEWVTAADIKRQFRPFIEQPDLVITKHFAGEKVTDTYPFVNINDKRSAFVTFNPQTADASFSLAMCMALDMKKGEKSTTLRFYYAPKKRKRK